MSSETNRRGLSRVLSSREKALELNLRRDVYGTFAEIGAGQEVAAHFFRVGQASGTVAKTMSAYDMTFSDSIYGPCEHYVCEPRLRQMLDKEYQLLTARLTQRSKRTNFFVFADTMQMATSRNNYVGHGWIGVRFQLYPDSEPNECILHTVLKERTPEAQQITLGKLGVNLLYACYHHNHPETFVLSLIDNISREKVDVNMLHLSGPDFPHIDNRLMCLQLVRHRLTDAVVFDAEGEALQPYEALSEKDVLVLRGRFRPITKVIMDMMESGLAAFKKESSVSEKDVVILPELTLTDLKSGGEVDEADFLHRMRLLCALGYTVLVSNYPEYYKLVNYLSKITAHRKLSMIVGFKNLSRIFEDSYYADLPGGTFEALSKIHGRNTSLYVYPTLLEGHGNKILTSKDVILSEKVSPLFDYFVRQGKIVDLESRNPKNLNIISDHVVNMIGKGDVAWEKRVPSAVREVIKREGLFGYREVESSLQDECDDGGATSFRTPFEKDTS